MGVGYPSSASNAEECYVVPPPQEPLINDEESDHQTNPLMICADIGGEEKA